MSIDIEQLKTDAAYWDDVAPEGATHFNSDISAWYKLCDGELFVRDEVCGVWAESAMNLKKLTSANGFIERPTSTGIPVDQPKKQLTQAVFDGLPAEYRWAVVDANGECWGFTGRPVVFNDGFYLDDDGSCLDDGAYDALFGLGYDATNWQNSLIERAAEPVVDLNQAPEGATHYTIKESGVIWFKDDYSFWNIWDSGKWEAIGLPASELTALPHQADPVNSPSHYASGGIECIDAMQAMLSREEFIGYLRGNIFKYQWRYKLKNGVEDLEKAQWYANRLIKMERGE